MPHSIQILVDRREQLPMEFKDYPVTTVPATLHTGDYSVAIKITRKDRKKLIDYVEKTYGIQYTLREVVKEGEQYSITIKFDDEIAIERKSLDDFVGSISDNRETFEKSVQRGSLLRFYAIFIESSEYDVIAHKYTSRILPQSVIDTAIRWSVKYKIQIIFCGDRINSEYHTYESLIGFLDYKKRGLL